MWYLVHWNQRNVYTKQRMLTALGQPSIDQLMLGTCVPVYKTLGWGWPQKITPLNTPLHMNHIKFLRMGEKRLVNSHRILKDKSYNWYESEHYTMNFRPLWPLTFDLPSSLQSPACFFWSWASLGSNQWVVSLVWLRGEKYHC